MSYSGEQRCSGCPVGGFIRETLCMGAWIRETQCREQSLNTGLLQSSEEVTEPLPQSTTEAADNLEVRWVQAGPVCSCTYMAAHNLL